MGVVLLVVKNWFLGTVSLLIAFFLLLSYSGIIIDTEKHKIKPYNNLFGLIKTGKWESVDHYIGLTLVPMNRIYTIYSRSNRMSESKNTDFRIYLVNKAKKPAIPIKKCKSYEKAHNSIDEFSIWLKLPVYSVKRK